jgi:hypothetical protein
MLQGTRMIIAKEVTDWEYNHTYLLSDDKMKLHGYWKHSKANDFVGFKTPLNFDKRRRQFKYSKYTASDES